MEAAAVAAVVAAAAVVKSVATKAKSKPRFRTAAVQSPNTV